MGDNNIQTLITLADEIINSQLTPEIIDKLENYSTAFNSWYSYYEASVTRGNPSNTKSELEDLLQRHEKVVTISDDLKDTMPAELSKLKQKGRGILAYTDLLPKKISFTKTRKG